MHLFLIFTSLVAAEAMIDDPMVHPQMKRELLQPRQTLPNINPSCTSALLGLYDSIPTPPARLVSAVGAEGGNPCSVTVPPSLSSDFSDYQSSIGSWYSDNSEDVSSALSDCPELSSLATLLPVCATSFLGGGAVSGSGTDTASSASSTGDSSTSSGGSATSQQTTETNTDPSASATGASATGTETDAAPKETGVALAALAAAGAIAAFM